MVLLAGCARAPDGHGAPTRPQEPVEPGAGISGADAIAARVGGRAISTADVDAPIVLALHDLEMQQFRLRRQSLEAEVLREFDSRRDQRVAELMLEPPIPPRVPVVADPARTRPAGAAPVTVLAFCNFESPHCARLQLTLSQVLPLFPGVVAYAERDLPLEFHRLAPKAAEAARCALEQGNYWRYHDALYALGGPPDRAMLERAARSSSLDVTAFVECLDRGGHAAAVAEDEATARSLGVSAVPAVFVNGLYASPDVRPADLVWLIEIELARLATASPRLEAAQVAKTEAFRLKRLLVSATAGQGLALIAPSAAPDRVGAFREGDAITAGVVVRRIGSDGVELLRDGHVEWLDFQAAAAPAQAGREATATGQPSPEELAAAYPHRGVPVTLDRDRVLVLLSDRLALAQALAPVPMTIDGQRLLRVEAVEPGSLYELLGIEPGDVIVSVNEQPLTEGYNPLWDALEKEGEVRVRVVRRGGLARHFTYRFGD